MTFPDISQELKDLMPELRGRLSANSKLSGVTWFRVGGPAQILFSPQDEEDLAYFLQNVPKELPILVIGLGSNLLVRDGGIPGIVIRLGRGFNHIEPLDNYQIKAGAAVPDLRLAKAAAEAEISGLAFMSGIPGGVGGALRMNGGAHGSETKDVLLSARAIDAEGTIHTLTNEQMGFSYRHCSIPEDWIFTEAVFQGSPGSKDEIKKDIEEVAEYRKQHQPIKGRTGGSTFKNPEGNSAWKLIDAAGCRGLRVGGAQVSEMHCNFLLNVEDATAEDLETLGETVRARVKETSGIELHWEIRRLGVPLS